MTQDEAHARARDFIDDVVKINARFGMRTVQTPGAYDSAVARAARSASRRRASPRKGHDMTLTQFLLARIAEDEERAQAAIGGNLTVCIDYTAEPVLDHIHAWSSGRVLAECAAKRRIVEEFQDQRTRAEIYQANVNDETTEDRDRRIRAWARQRGLEIAVEELASVYAAHESFQEEWATTPAALPQ